MWSVPALDISKPGLTRWGNLLTETSQTVTVTSHMYDHLWKTPWSLHHLEHAHTHKHARTHTHIHKRVRARTHAHTHARTHARTHTHASACQWIRQQQQNVDLFLLVHVTIYQMSFSHTQHKTWAAIEWRGHFYWHRFEKRIHSLQLFFNESQWHSLRLVGICPRSAKMTDRQHHGSIRAAFCY